MDTRVFTLKHYEQADSALFTGLSQRDEYLKFRNCELVFNIIEPYRSRLR